MTKRNMTISSYAPNQKGFRDLPPMVVPPVMLARQARGQGRQARVPQTPAAGSRENCAA